MKKAIRIIALVMSVVMISAVAVACSGGGGNGGGTTPVEQKNKWGGVPNGKTFDGKEFVISTYHDGNDGKGWTCYFDIDEPEEGDQMENAAYRRNLAIEDDLNCTITCNEDWFWHGTNDGYFFVSSAIQNGDDFVSLYFLESYIDHSNFVIDGLVYDAATLPYITWDADYYAQKQNELFKLGNKRYTFISDMTYPCQSSVMMLVNRERLVDLGYGDTYVYDLVNNNQWLFETVFQMVEGQQEDLNRDGVMDELDYYGLAGNPYSCTYFFPAAGLRGAYLTDSGFEFDYGSDRATRVVDRIYDFIQKPEVWVSEWDKEVMMFHAQHALFGTWASELRGLSGLDFEFGILPYPMFDDTQSTYSSYANGGYMIVPSNITDPDLVGALIEAMSVGSQKELVPAFYDRYIQQRIIQDDYSRENWARMLTDWACYEFTHVYSPSEYVTYYAPAFKTIQSVSMGGVNDYSSYWGRIASACQNKCNEFYETFMKAV